MSDFIQKKDYWSIILFAWVFIGCYFLSKELSSNNLLIVLPVSGLGAFVGYKLSNWVTDKPVGMKVLLVLIWSVIFVGSLLIGSSRQNDEKKLYQSNIITLLMGKWETDEDEGFKIRLEINQDEVIMSMSPDFTEIEYDLMISENSLHFRKAGSLKFNFTIENIDDSSLTLRQSEETLVFTRVD